MVNATPQRTSEPGDVVYLLLHLLDRQVIDSDDRLVCKVDDLDLERDADGNLYVAALLTGPLALGPRIGGRLGRWMSAIARRLSPSPDPGPGRIDYDLVTDIGSSITISPRASRLELAALESWVDRYVIGRIPGSRHESE